VQSKGIISLASTVVLCIPSLAGAGSLVVNEFLQRNIGDWGIVSSALVAFGVFFGWPLVIMAALVSGLAGFSHRVSQRLKHTNYVVVGLATAATIVLKLRFWI
jgi:small-conductance mechanosensitive channel